MPLTQDPAQTDIEIVSQAIQLCGKKKINSIDTGDEFAESASEFYGSLVNAELGSNRWRFALHYQAMGTLTALTPAFEGWNYYWDFPSDLIMLHRIYPFVNYTVFGDRLVTRSDSTLTAIYSRVRAVSKWPEPFKMYMIYALANMLAPSVTLSDKMVARIEGGLLFWKSRALFADGQNSPARTMRDQPYKQIRRGGGSSWQ